MKRIVHVFRRSIAYVLTTAVLGWLLLGCRCPKPPPVVQPAPVVTVAPPVECLLPARPSKPPMYVEAIEDGRLAASQFLWADIVGYVAASEAYADAALACLTAQAVQQ